MSNEKLSHTFKKNKHSVFQIYTKISSYTKVIVVFITVEITAKSITRRTPIMPVKFEWYLMLIVQLN